MTWNRPKRFAIVLFAMVNLLFMQLSLAAYACPAASAGQASAQMAEMQAAGMPCAETMAWVADEEQPNLCAAHCKADASSPDKHELPGIAMLAAPASDYVLVDIGLLARATPVEPPRRARGAGPSLAVRHCCFRL